MVESKERNACHARELVGFGYEEVAMYGQGVSALASLEGAGWVPDERSPYLVEHWEELVDDLKSPRYAGPLAVAALGVLTLLGASLPMLVLLL